MVCEDGGIGETRHRGPKEGGVDLYSRAVWQGISPLAREYPGLVYLKAALVGPSDTRLLLYKVRPYGGGPDHAGRTL